MRKRIRKIENGIFVFVYTTIDKNIKYSYSKDTNKL